MTLAERVAQAIDEATKRCKNPNCDHALCKRVRERNHADYDSLMRQNRSVCG